MLPKDDPAATLVYLDWNVCQHMLNDPRLQPLTASVLIGRSEYAFLAPFGPGHVFDATAGWWQLGPSIKAKATRTAAAVSGLLSGVAVDFEELGSPEPLRFRNGELLTELAARGFFDSPPDLDDPAWVAAREALRAQVEFAILVMEERMPADQDDKVLAVMDELKMTLRQLPDLVHDDGLIAQAPMMMMRAALLPYWADLPASVDGPLDDALKRLDEELGRKQEGLTFSKLMKDLPGMSGSTGAEAVHEDLLGPALMGWFGMGRDPRKAVAKLRPGGFADQMHAGVAMQSAIFITADRLLHRRVSAWSHYKGVGAGCNRWPISLYVSPDDERSVEEAALLVGAFTHRFQGSLVLE